jgi:hypothetical protein
MSAAQQLKLFSEPTVGNIYRAGDWVKTKRKPEIAAHIKRGEYFVHPENGSVKIWNPHINQWDFLYPDEIKLTKSLTPITIVETVVEQIATQLTVESVVEQIHNCHNGWVESHYKIRRNGKQHSIGCPEIGCTGPYYMYRWREGKKQRAKYLPVNKYPKILQAIARARPIEEILKIISSQ